MEDLTRRDLLAALSAFTAAGSVLGRGAFAQSKTGEASSPNRNSVLSRSQVFSYDALSATTFPNGGTMRRVISGVLPTGEFIEVHETMLPAGQMPHPPHRHRNSELLFIRDGQLEFINNGKAEPVGPGDVVFTASNVMHGLKNIGARPANYFVIAISRPDEEG